MRRGEVGLWVAAAFQVSFHILLSSPPHHHHFGGGRWFAEWVIIMQEGGTGLWDMGRLYSEASRWCGGLDWKTWRLDDKCHT